MPLDDFKGKATDAFANAKGEAPRPPLPSQKFTIHPDGRTEDVTNPKPEGHTDDAPPDKPPTPKLELRPPGPSLDSAGSDVRPPPSKLVSPQLRSNETPEEFKRLMLLRSEFNRAARDAVEREAVNRNPVDRDR